MTRSGTFGDKAMAIIQRLTINCSLNEAEHRSLHGEAIGEPVRLQITGRIMAQVNLQPPAVCNGCKMAAK